MRDLAALDQITQRCDVLATFGETVAARVAPRVEEIIRGNMARQVAPDGTAWPATEDGHPALTHAAKSLRVFARGLDVVVELDGVPARHDVGRVRGGVRRQIVPSSLSPAMAAAVDEVAREEWARVMGGGA